MPDQQNAGASLRNVDWAVLHSKDISEASTICVLIHGFTSSGIYMQGFGQFLRGEGIQTFIFDYPSWAGIQQGANDLSSLLTTYDRDTLGTLKKKRVFLVGHSMGGLVARAASLYTNANDLIGGIATVGTPNDGTLQNSKIISGLIQIGTLWSKLTINGATGKFNRFCVTAQELMKNDGRNYIDDMNSSARQSRPNDVLLAVSGGLPELDFGRGKIRNYIKNTMIQFALSGQTNDGLIAEFSVGCLENYGPHYEFRKNYSAYPTLNHTFLKDNQEIWCLVRDWIRVKSLAGQIKQSP